MDRPAGAVAGLQLARVWRVAVLLAGLAGWGWFNLRLVGRALQFLQLEGYQTGRYLVGWVRRPTRLVPSRLLAGAAGGVLIGLASWASGPWLTPFVAVWAALGWWLAVRTRFPSARKPLVMTSRATRLAGGVGFLGLVAGAVSARSRPAALLVALSGAALLPPLLVAAANLLLYPVEALVRRYYLRDAATKLRRLAPTVLAVAGSYGKTSTKEFLAAILSERFEVLKPPGSYNTPLGLARVIREELSPRHELFVAELGDWVPGDIAFLCKLIEPKVGVLVNIGPEHLERFKTMERVAQSKRELLEALPADGVAVINQDDPTVRRLAAEAWSGRVVRFGQREPGAEVRASAVRAAREGLELTVEAEGQGSVTLRVGVLGRHNVENLLAAVSAALAVGMTLEEVARGARRIQPVEHRLQPISGAGGVLIVDDAFNSNPRGAAAALEVLKELPGGQKILVTPGLVELGAAEYAANQTFGRQAAAVCDAVILVGEERAVPLLAGLREAGYPAERSQVVRDLTEATAWLGTLVRAGDVVLFENDLPDTYADPM
jgi:UDP-N-acetylmuramoyl-tripeptide--D-alanyl-D-alanine ligase